MTEAEPSAAPDGVAAPGAPAATTAGGMPAATGRPADDLGIRDFADYDVIIDARSPREYDDDHLPGAINLPVVGDDQFAVVGILHKTDRHRAYLRGVADSLRNMADALDRTLAGQPPHARILVYCFRGGKRSRLWADTLHTVGFRTEKLEGGWKRYRRWVIASLETVPRQFQYRVLNGPTGCGKTRLLQALEAAGEQVLDLEGLARHRGSLIGAVPGVAQPGQKLFESIVLDRLRGFDPSRPVWVEAESKKIGAVQLPTALFEALHASPQVYSLSLPMAERVRIWHEDFGHFASDPGAMLERLQHLVPLVGRDEFDAWQDLADARRIDELFERIMANHYDPAYARTAKRNYRRQPMVPIALEDLAPQTLAEVARTLAATAGGPIGGAAASDGGEAGEGSARAAASARPA
jgi:tRNA 2-selenouridine synthase